ncbi:HAD-IIA family hydrolase [Pseudorhodoplanes sinuspersici]|nr:HAD family hydrolase [Pseudorhodoplanes sinuspersici]RKE68462.1 HAD superfamily hydrolase (TIGR01450 family) [Pseudorhodoplanes sinuspersici]
MSAHRKIGYLVDLDGTLMSGAKALPGAVQLIERLERRFVIVSNDAEHTPAQLSRRLRAAKLMVPEERIVLAGTTTLDCIMKEEPEARVMLIGSVALNRYARGIGLRLSEGRPDIVVLARDQRFTYGRLAKAANAIRAGARLIVSNPDHTHPGLAGEIVPETGALLSALLACTGPLSYRVIGKPEPTLFLKGLDLLGIASDQGVVIGDNPDTDGAGARRMGLRFVRVHPGAMLGVDDIDGYREITPQQAMQAAI